MKTTENYYARATDVNGKTMYLKVGSKGTLVCKFMRLVTLESNAKKVFCDNNELTSLILPSASTVYCTNNQLTILDLPNATEVYCRNNKLTNLDLPNATEVYCEDNKLTSLDLPNAKEIYCDDNPLKSIVKNCGNLNRQIWSQRIGKTIYTYIGCGRFTLDEAIKAINKKYSGKEAEDYIEKVRLSQDLVESND